MTREPLHPQIAYDLIQDEARDLFQRKNKDYGNGFVACGVPGIMVRLLDKFQRAVTVSRGSLSVKTESLRDTLMDAANYCLMGVVLLDLSAQQAGREDGGDDETQETREGRE